MTKYEVLVSQTARKQLRILEEGTRERVKKGLIEIRDDPTHSRPKAEVNRLKGPRRDYFRLRVGDYRVVYTIEESEILVVRIFHRSSGYSWLE
ncbi:MAG: type II toxin-antitoxin system RelE/ParE family toxin [Thermoplasmata archaeon]|nr:type II toxin-antitoxin system RelE/ParE family toxin [Thermoplasmata archaeon]